MKFEVQAGSAYKDDRYLIEKSSPCQQFHYLFSDLFPVTF